MSINKPLAKGGKPQQQRANSKSITGNSNSSLSREDDLAKQKRGGIFGMFGHKKTASMNQANSVSSGTGPTNPIKPVPKR